MPAPLEEARHRLLWVCPYSLHPPIHGSAVRTLNLFRYLSRDFDLYAMVFLGGSDDPEQRQALKPYCREIFFHQADSPGELREDLPPEAARLASPLLAERLESLTTAHGIDLVVLDCAELGQYALTCGKARRVLVEPDLLFITSERRQALAFDRRYGDGAPGEALARLRRRYELAICQEVDQVHLMSEVDRDLLVQELRRVSPQTLRVVPNGVDPEYHTPGPPAEERADLLFVGSFPHLPNLDALDTFLKDAWPLLRQQMPGARLTVAGARPPERVLDLDGEDGLRVVGEVDDLRPLYRSHRALVVPVRAGSGTRLKIVEAFASALPVISTSLGVEGILARPEKDFLLADTAAEQVAACRRLLEDNGLVDRLGAAGRRLAEGPYSWARSADAARQGFLELLEHVPPPSPAESWEGGLEITVILTATSENLEQVVEAVGNQRIDRSVELLWLGPPSAAPSGVRAIELPPGDEGGTALDRAAAQAKGQVLVFLGREQRPADEHWLDRLTAPFFYPAAPSAVVGTVAEEAWPRGGVLPTTADERAWHEEAGEVRFHPGNGAVRREIWRAWPFGPGDPATVWNRRLTAAGHLVLPCWAAMVRTRSPGPGPALKRWAAEGRSFRRMGHVYRLSDLLTDLKRNTSDQDMFRQVKTFLRTGHPLAALVPWLHPLARFAGNRLYPRALTKDCQGFTTPASGPGR